ncbi:dihydroorotase [Treponema zuelzerae]|uniref:Dihydroorotase n=1 Tax=Teretinema zuelzerae TaxID=156 RepID=A0AAE3JKW5_9SPIR|nr:dihydroorotase [Teretinema zuelzerae]MCD1655660.1 dihydroorotase [Teretinema zuelzerae]
MSSTLVLNARLIDKNTDCPGAVLIRGERIAGVFRNADSSSARRLAAAALAADSGTSDYDEYDAKGAVLMPAFVDLHAHFRDPGFTHKEDLLSASRAAAAGGYGTVVLMANTDPVISDGAAAAAVRERVREIGLIDAFQAVSLTRNFDGRDASALSSLDSREVPVATEDGREVASSAVMLDAMRRCAAAGVVVSCHCEDPELAAGAKPFRAQALAESDSSRVKTLLGEAECRLRLAEDLMTDRNLSLAAASGCRVHIAHASTAGVLESIRRAKKQRAPVAVSRGGDTAIVSPVTCEATPHHLVLTDDYPAIVNPPLRPAADRAALVAALLDGTIDAIATDHAPHTPADKAAGAPGFSGIQTAFAVCFTELVGTGLVGLSRLSALMAANPAEILGLERGLLKEGWRADLALADVDSARTLDPDDESAWFSKGKNTPLAGTPLRGWITAVWNAGRRVYPFS